MSHTLNVKHCASAMAIICLRMAPTCNEQHKQDKHDGMSPEGCLGLGSQSISATQVSKHKGTEQEQQPEQQPVSNAGAHNEPVCNAPSNLSAPNTQFVGTRARRTTAKAVRIPIEVTGAPSVLPSGGSFGFSTQKTFSTAMRFSTHGRLQCEVGNC